MNFGRDKSKRERVSPFHSQESEAAVLGTLLRDPTQIPRARKLLRSEYFFAPHHEHLFAAMESMDLTTGVPDNARLLAEIKASDKISDVGGMDYLGEIYEFGESANIEEYARTIVAHARRRRLVDALSLANSAAMDPESDPEEVACRIQAEVLAIAVNDEHAGFREVTWTDITELAEAIALRGEAVDAGKLPGIASGYREIDDVTQGFRKKEFILFGAVPKSWKTALTDNILMNMIRDGRIVGKVAAEMTREETEERMIAAGARIQHSSLGRGQLSHEDWKRFFATGRELEGRIHIDDEAFPELGDVVARCTDLKTRVPSVEVIAVDYLQLVTSHERGRRGDEEIQLVCRALKGLAKRLDVVMIAPAQANYKEVDGRPDRRPLAKDLQGSSGMGQTPNFIAMLYWDRLYNANAAPILEVNFVYSRRTAPFLARLYAYPEYQLLTNRGAPMRPELALPFAGNDAP
jgi:replicative DNA helicase